LNSGIIFWILPLFIFNISVQEILQNFQKIGTEVWRNFRNSNLTPRIECIYCKIAHTHTHTHTHTQLVILYIKKSYCKPPRISIKLMAEYQKSSDQWTVSFQKSHAQYTYTTYCWHKRFHFTQNIFQVTLNSIWHYLISTRGPRATSLTWVI
jgi:hypothetical protein